MVLKNLKAHLCSYFSISPLSIHSRIYDLLIQMLSLCCYLMSIQKRQNLKNWKLAWNCELSPGIESWLLKMSASFSSWVQSQNHWKVVRLIQIPEAAEIYLCQKCKKFPKWRGRCHSLCRWPTSVKAGFFDPCFCFGVGTTRN